MHEALWTKIVTVHNYNKTFFIWCEENGIGLKSFLQPNNELKNAWEHSVRAKSNELGIAIDENNPNAPDANYQESCLKDALKHEYRAFFDICDWLSWTLRTLVQKDLAPYDHEAISEVIPDYFSEIRPRLDAASHEIAKLRCKKDAEAGDIIAHVEKYNSVLTALIKDIEKIRNSVGALADYKKRRKASKIKEYFLVIVLGAAIGGAFIAFFDHFGEIKDWLCPPKEIALTRTASQSPLQFCSNLSG
jgi:hypothetical protein